MVESQEADAGADRFSHNGVVSRTRKLSILDNREALLNIMLTLVSLPSFSDLTSKMSDYSIGIFNEFMPMSLWIVGLVIGALLLLFLSRSILRAFSQITHSEPDFDTEYYYEPRKRRGWSEGGTYFPILRGGGRKQKRHKYKHEPDFKPMSPKDI